MIIRRLIVPLTFAAVVLHAGQAFAQGALPAPLSGQSDASVFPPERWAASDACMTGFVPLRQEAEARGILQ